MKTEIATGSPINLLRVAISNRGNQLKFGVAAYVIVKSPKRQTLTLSMDAVVRHSKSAFEWIKKGTNTFKNRMVPTGMEGNGATLKSY